MQYAMPVMDIGTYDEAVAFYVDWLGFDIDWEWRANPDAPVYMQVSRDGLYLRLNGYKSDGPKHCMILVDDLDMYLREWKAKRPEWAEEMQSAMDKGDGKLRPLEIMDPFDNTLAIQEDRPADQ